MKFIRALLFSIILYAFSFLVYGVVNVFVNQSESLTLLQYSVYWILNIPVILLLAKWYFKAYEPTVKRGVILGIIAVVVAFFFDGVSIATTMAAGESIDIFKGMYMDWKLYVTIVEIIAVCAFAGYEFDKTYTKK